MGGRKLSLSGAGHLRLRANEAAVTPPASSPTVALAQVWDELEKEVAHVLQYGGSVKLARAADAMDRAVTAALDAPARAPAAVQASKLGVTPVSDALALIHRALAMRDYGDKPNVWEQIWKDIEDAARRLGSALAVGSERASPVDGVQAWIQELTDEQLRECCVEAREWIDSKRSYPDQECVSNPAGLRAALVRAAGARE